jgi:Flp pilus assembly protein CpaB
VERGNPVKRQTLILVLIGVVLFVAGGGIAFATVVAGSNHTTGATEAPVNTPVVVAKSAIPVGTTGQTMVAQGLVAIQLIPQKEYVASDLTSLVGLTDEVLTSAVHKGSAVEATELTPSTTSISLPKGDDGVAISMAGVAGLAGYLQPGSDVDVYANINKLSQGTQPLSSAIAIPCTELLMTDIQVLDTSSVVPALGRSSSSAGRTVPSTITVLLAVNPNQARVLQFMSQNETISVAQTQKGTQSVAVGACIGTGQTAIAP